MGDVFLTFLRLGLTSFGGPIAHLGYFRREFVERRGWLSEEAYAHIVAFCSVLPGPTSSQVGMSVGFVRGGPLGALLAWIGFTAPSAIALALVAAGLTALESANGDSPAWLTGLLAGLTAAAAAVVAQAVLGMARTLCPDRETQTIAIGAAILALSLQSVAGFQWVPIATGAVVGTLFLSRRMNRGNEIVEPLPFTVTRPVAIACGAAFVIVLGGAALAAPLSESATLLAAIVRAGSLVFGGGHVVLPLLQSVIGSGLMPARDFYAGYGAAQAVPGPLFTFAAFLGEANLSPLHGALGALVTTVAIFVPSFLLVFALAPVWNAVRLIPGTGGALRGANASVVGLLASVLYSPIITNLGTSVPRLAIALAAFALVMVWKAPPWVVVACAALAGVAASLAGAAL